ncbi:N-acetylmuramoyl-L-alanine amidase [Candidatus Nucleicultrix amoebiphila]|jgi:N-acetylmuramoyl-L-alanine amidase|uniref:N-acetylmuramoyl-L-alanine amidase n=1 Tax=Candidatus Nucleicultrix amoebiphila FS5 TaxID=1414854 RepID=A0A1W6N6L7_9PROT|nr:N-acetylmuramoyl-L-alanine amidase [Candidatus Nucleicultrix amoebiphila]ARN85422.1 hypothetical protein GQ61_09140 [Candidatus Nucleicultrix amoebiphila FS5]
MKIQSIPSPNFNERPKDGEIDFLIIHYTACDLDLSLQILTDATSAHPVSAHYLIDEEGSVYGLVPEEKRAWHAATDSSYWRGHQNINNRSIGVELVNPGHGPDYRDFSEPQMESLLKLSQEIINRHPIQPSLVLGHSDVDPIRKSDPGERFNWHYLAENGIGIPPVKDVNFHDSQSVSILDLQKALHEFGYKIPQDNKEDLATRRAVQAFQMHYCPFLFNGGGDSQTLACLNLLKQSI